MSLMQRHSKLSRSKLKIAVKTPATSFKIRTPSSPPENQTSAAPASSHYFSPMRHEVKAKVKFTLEQATKAQGGRGNSSTLSLTSALDGVGGQRHAPASLCPGKTRYPVYRRLGGPQSGSGRVRKTSPPP